MIGNYLTMSEFVDEFRKAVGDVTCEVPVKSIINWTNTALRRLAREKGLDVLFRYQDTFELAPMNKDGSKTTSWFLRGFSVDDKVGSPRIGTIIDVESMLVLEADDCRIHHKELCYLPFDYFRREYPFPEERDCLTAFTITEFGGDTKLTFNAPVEGHTVIDMVYTAFHPRITSTDELVRIPYAYVDILMECVKILMHEESADMSTARSLYEDWDYLVAQARERLHQQKAGFGLRQIKGSF